MSELSSAISQAASAIANADAILIGAGAGIGVDSGLPDFRGNEGFWKAYPPFQKAGLSFVDLANPSWFDRDPELAWGFYGHRLSLYRQTEPHEGFEVLLRWCQTIATGGFVFTSNVDGQFQRAGFADDQLIEYHGSIHHLQCARPCTEAIWDNHDEVSIDRDFRATSPAPSCPRCGEIARPNILMFGDGGWLPNRTAAQEQQLKSWAERVATAASSLAVIELGAGLAVPTVRHRCEHVASVFGAPLIRINPRESHGPAGTISIAMGAKDALEAIDSKIR